MGRDSSTASRTFRFMKTLLASILLILGLSLQGLAGETNLVSVKADGAPLAKVLKQIATQMDYNIYLVPGLSGTVDTDLRQVPGFGAIELILRTQPGELTFKVVDRTIVVGSPERLSKIPDSLFRSSDR